MYSLEGVAQAGVELWGGPHPFTLKALALTKYCTPCIWRGKRNRRVIAMHHPCHPQSAALSLLIHPPRGEGVGCCHIGKTPAALRRRRNDWRAINTIGVDICV